MSSSLRRSRVLTAPSFDSQDEHQQQPSSAVYESIASNIRYYDGLRKGHPPQVPDAVVRSSSMSSSRQRTKSPINTPSTRVVMPASETFEDHQSSYNHSGIHTHSEREATRAPASASPVHEGSLPSNRQGSSPPQFAVAWDSLEAQKREYSNSPVEPLASTTTPALDGGLASPIADPPQSHKYEPNGMAPESSHDQQHSNSREGGVKRVGSQPRGPSSMSASSNLNGSSQERAPGMTPVRAVAQLPKLMPVREAASQRSSLPQQQQHSTSPLGDSSATKTKKVVRSVVRRGTSSSSSNNVGGAAVTAHSDTSGNSPTKASNKEASMTAAELRWYRQFKQTVTVTKQWREHSEALEKERDEIAAELQSMTTNHSNLQGKCVDLVRVVSQKDSTIAAQQSTIEELERSNDELLKSRITNQHHHQEPSSSALYESQQQTIERLSEMLDEQHRSTAHRLEATRESDWANPNLLLAGTQDAMNPKAFQQLRTQCSQLATQLADATDVQRRYRERAGEAEVRFLERQLVEERRRVHELFETLWQLTKPTNGGSSHTAQHSASYSPLPNLFPRSAKTLDSDMGAMGYTSGMTGRGSPQRLQRGSEHHMLNNLYHLQCVDTTDNCEERLASYFKVVEGLQQALISSRMHQAGAEQASTSMKEVMGEVLESIQKGAKTLYRNTKLIPKVRDGLLYQQQLLSRQSRAIKSNHSQEVADRRALLDPSESPRNRHYAPDGLPPRHSSSSVTHRSHHHRDDSSDRESGTSKRKREKRSKRDKHHHRHRHSRHEGDSHASHQMSSAYVSDGLESAETRPPASGDEGEQYLAHNVTEATGMAKETYEQFMTYTSHVDAASDILKRCIQGLRAVLRIDLNNPVDDSNVSVSDVASDIGFRSPSSQKQMDVNVLDSMGAPQELLRGIEADIQSFKQSSSEVVSKMSAALKRERLNHKQDCDAYLRRLRLGEEEYRDLLIGVSRYLPNDFERGVGTAGTEVGDEEDISSYNNNNTSSYHHNDDDRRSQYQHYHRRYQATTNSHHPPDHYAQPSTPSHYYQKQQQHHGRHQRSSSVILNQQEYEHQEAFPHPQQEQQHQYRSSSAPQYHQQSSVIMEEEPRFDPIVPGTPGNSTLHHSVITPLATSRNTSTEFPRSTLVQRKVSGAFAARQHTRAHQRGHSVPASRPSSSRASTPASSHRYFFNNTSEDLRSGGGGTGRGQTISVDSRQTEPRQLIPHPTPSFNKNKDIVIGEEEVISSNQMYNNQHHTQQTTTTTVRTNSTNTRGSIPAPEPEPDLDDDIRDEVSVGNTSSEYARSFLAADDVRGAAHANPNNAAMAIHLMLHGQQQAGDVRKA